MEVKFVDYGIAYRVNKKIYLNRVLMKDKKVMEEILEHEWRHDDGFYNLHDLLLDMQPTSWHTTIFFLKNPSTWSVIWPFFKLEGKWYYDPATFLNIFLGLIVGGLLCLRMIF